MAKLTRREFIRLAGGVVAALGLGAVGIKEQRPIIVPEATTHIDNPSFENSTDEWTEVTYNYIPPRYIFVIPEQTETARAILCNGKHFATIAEAVAETNRS